MPLLLATDFDELPNEPIARWLSLRDKVEKRLDDSFDFNNGPETHQLLEYVEILSAAADELDVGPLELLSPGKVREEFDHFRARVAALATRLSIRQITNSSARYLHLSAPVQDRLLNEVDRLRDIVAKSNLNERKTDKLNSLLDKLTDEIKQERIDYKELMRTLAFCAAGLGGTTAFLADAPDAIATIAQVVGLQEEAAEEQEKVRLIAQEPAVPQLPSPPRRLGPPQDEAEQ